MDSSVFAQVPQFYRERSKDDYELLERVPVESREPLLPSQTATSWNIFSVPDSDSSVYSQVSMECCLDDAYRYFYYRGFLRFVLLEISHIVVWSWLVLFVIFLGTCVDFSKLSQTVLTTPTGVWQFIDFSNYARNWFFGLCLALFSGFAIWRILKFTHDVKRMWKMRGFYRKRLGIVDFDLKCMAWSTVLLRLQSTLQSDFQLSKEQIIRMITARDNAFQKLLSLVDFTFTIPKTSQEISLLTRGLQWNMFYCVVNYFFGPDQQLVRVEQNPEVLSRRILVVSVLNIILMPFIVIFVALYAIFRYVKRGLTMS
jgi:autophagy-related protein 9